VETDVPARAERSGGGRRKLVEFDSETFHALQMLARDRMMTFQELADEAFRDLLRKHGRPVDLHDALKRSAGAVQPPGQGPAPVPRRRIGSDRGSGRSGGRPRNTRT
jgi:hypothetical protein